MISSSGESFLRTSCSGIHHHIYTEEYKAQRYDTRLLTSEQRLKLTCLFEFILEDTDT